MISRQEMFDRAVRGLRSQGFERCADSGGCRYFLRGRRCAWGWVDPRGTAEQSAAMYGDVYYLHDHRIGLAAILNPEDLEWARKLQLVHDNSSDHMENDLRAFGVQHGLTWPTDHGEGVIEY